MKQKITLKSSDGTTISKEVTVRNLEHLNTQLKYRSTRQESKKAYNRQKYKKFEY